MKKLMSICCLVICLFVAGNVSAATSGYVYTLDVDIPDASLFGGDEFMIGGIEFMTSGGEFGTDWQVSLGNGVPAGVGNWIFENFGEWNLLYDDYDNTAKDYTPLQSGNALTITSSVELIFSELSFADFKNRDVNPQYFTTQGFVEQQSSVPIPSGFFLLGTGLIGLLGLSRRR